MDYIRLLDLATLIVISTTNALVFYNLYTFNRFDNIPILDINSPLIFPFLIAVALLILILAIVVTHLKLWREYEVEREGHLEDLRDLRTVILYFISLVVYVLLVERFHFRLTTFVFCMGAMFIFSLKEYKVGFIKRVGVTLLLSLCLVYFIDVVFYRIFLVNLP